VEITFGGLRVLNHVIAPRDFLRASGNIETVDLKFTDLVGRWRQIRVPSAALDLQSIADRDACVDPAVRWRHAIRLNDIEIAPDPATAFFDPFADTATVAIICNVRRTDGGLEADPRSVAERAEAYLRSLQIGDLASFAAKIGFSLQPSPRGDGSRAALPIAALRDFQTEAAAVLARIGIDAEPCQDDGACHQEFCIRPANLTRMADSLMIFRYVIGKVARQHDAVATFAPIQPLNDESSNLDVFQSVWDGERPLFAGDGYGGTSAFMRHYLAGLLEHSMTLLGICALAANPLHLLAPRFERRVNFGLSRPDRAAPCSAPLYSADPAEKGVEFRCSYASSNPYLIFSAMLMAGLDGFRLRRYNLDRDKPIESFCNQFALPPGEDATAGEWLADLIESLHGDHAFLLEGDVFSSGLIHFLTSRARKLMARKDGATLLTSRQSPTA
jgi:glutamine synthetase